MENTEENPLIINENEKLVESSDPFDDGSESKVSEEGIKSPLNVRTRVEQLVKSKFVGIVNEIRKNSPPIVVRRWADNNPTENAVSVVEDDRKDDQSDQILESKEVSEVLNQSCESNDNVEESSPSRKKISSFTSILTKLNLRQFDNKSTVETEESTQGTSFTFSDFYEKFSSNRDRYQSIKARKMDIKRMLSNAIESHTTENISKDDEAIDESHESKELAITSSSPKIESKEFVLTSSDPNIDWSLKPPAPTQTRPRRNIRKIGRCSSESVSSTRISNKKKFALASIGRSFSVAEPEDDATDDSLASDKIFVTIHESNVPSSLQTSTKSINISSEASSINMMVNSLPVSPARVVASDEESGRRKLLTHDASFQSDSSYCSSVESLLDARKPDPEAILRACGFGPPRQEDVISRIPKRFLKPSQVRGIDTNEFLKRQKFANQMYDSTAFGYRGLIDYEKLQILQRFEHRPKSGPK